VSVRFGPAAMSFRGEVTVNEIDAATRTLRLAGRGTVSTGSSGASMDLTARIEAVDARSCKLVGTSEVSVSGKAAAFGGRMMSTVADQVLQQFVANFAQRLQTAPAAGAADEALPAAAAPAREINGLALAWALVRDWFHQLFSPRRA
jgi:carbon monoxide dehydrogenase subunit G